MSALIAGLNVQHRGIHWYLADVAVSEFFKWNFLFFFFFANENQRRAAGHILIHWRNLSGTKGINVGKEVNDLKRFVWSLAQEQWSWMRSMLKGRKRWMARFAKSSKERFFFFFLIALRISSKESKHYISTWNKNNLSMSSNWYCLTQDATISRFWKVLKQPMTNAINIKCRCARVYEYMQMPL